jgi:hypothetical protein
MMCKKALAENYALSSGVDYCIEIFANELFLSGLHDIARWCSPSVNRVQEQLKFL